MGLFGNKPVLKFNVEGMTCNHCVMRVTKAIEGLDGVKNVEVDLEGKSATVTLKKEGSSSAQEIISAVEEAGYQASQS